MLLKLRAVIVEATEGELCYVSAKRASMMEDASFSSCGL
jgi:hypothetical protein